MIEDDYIKKIRASYYLLGALLGKYKHAEVALPYPGFPTDMQSQIAKVDLDKDIQKFKLKVGSGSFV